MLVLLFALGVASAARKTQQKKRLRKPPVRHVRVQRKPAAISKKPAPLSKKPAPISKKPAPVPTLPPAYFKTPDDATETAAFRYGQLTRTACETELKKRNIPFKREVARGVVAPVRLEGPLQGIFFRGEGTDRERAVSPHEIVDCRLVLALDDSTATLRAHDVTEVRHFSLYRLPPPSWPAAQPATRHLGGLAIDMGRFIKKDGSVLDVDRHFHGAIDAKVCGAGAAPRPATPEAVELRALLCKLVDLRIFNVVLTPNYNAPHKNHFHMEITVGKRWFLLH